MNFDLNDEQAAIQQAARTFAETVLAPEAAHWDQHKIFPRAAIAQAGEMGFCGMYTREDVGGLGLPRLDASIAFEELAAACPSTTAYITIHNMVTWMIDTFAKPEIRQLYCPELAAGTKLGSYCLTEPGSGSDAAALRTTATKKGSSYILKGSKAFVSGGGETDVLVVMARTGASGPKGVSAFVVPTSSKGITFGENERKLGWNSQSTRVIYFDDVTVDESHLLGTEGSGFRIAMKGLDGGRINIATCSVGAAQAALTQTQKYMHQREQFGKALASFQALQFKLADMLTETVASRQMVRLAATKLDQQSEDASVYCAMAKRLATDLSFKVCNDALQIHGGYGFTQEYPLERLMRDARAHQIVEGTNEIMRVIIARAILEEGAALTLR
ncbi:MAG: acyl-CoA dehydrogenase family protein [Proteobacteria bacterium]|nr:acyl-CoA dehydrogenase family protein [Pseudomonadota bacterium]